MSTPRPELSGAPASLTRESGDPFDGLIARLANELFEKSPGDAASPMLPSSLVPGTLATPEETPCAALPALASAPNAGRPSVSNRSTDLSGGFPTTSSSTPPVHPVLESDTARTSQPTGTPTGAHNPESSDTHAFGEPRLTSHCGPRTPDLSPQHLAHRQCASPAGLDFAGHAPSIPGVNLAPAPDFYFISERPSAPARQNSLPPLSAFDVETVRKDFPILHQQINGHPLVWLDNAATTQKPRQVINATSSFYSRDNSNIHRAAYTLAERSTKLFEAGREKVRQFLGARDTKEIVFLRGTTEAINLVAQSFGRKNVGAGDEILLTELEHHANIVPWQILAEQVGAVIRVVPINDRGELILEEYARLLSPRTKIVSVAHVSNSLGTVNPVEEIIAMAHGYGARVLIDGAQSTPHLPVNVTALDADFYVFPDTRSSDPPALARFTARPSYWNACLPGRVADI